MSPAQGAVISRDAEISLGREGAQEYEKQAAVDADPVLAARVRRIGNRLIAAADGTVYPFEFHAVETNGINAFALPGGFIYVFRGLAQLMPGDDALAFILAHEIIHVSRRHGVRQLEKSLAFSTLIGAALGGGFTSGLLSFALDMHYSRHDEAEADRLGLEMMARAGFDPTQAAEAMAVLARTAKSQKFMPALLRSHPLPEGRVVALKRQAAALKAAPRAPRAVPSAPPLPEPDSPAPPAAVVRSELFPLAVGMRWTYRLSGPEKPLTATTSVLEEQPGLPGVYRVRVELDEGFAATRLLAVTPDGVCGQPGSPSHAAAAPPSTPKRRVEWQREISLPAGDAEAWETVRVPAGEYRAVRTVQRSPGGESATVWLAPGVGVVRRAWQRTGLVEELQSFRRAVPEAEAGPPADAATPGQ